MKVKAKELGHISASHFSHCIYKVLYFFQTTFRDYFNAHLLKRYQFHENVQDFGFYIFSILDSCSWLNFDDTSQTSHRWRPSSKTTHYIIHRIYSYYSYYSLHNTLHFKVVCKCRSCCITMMSYKAIFFILEAINYYILLSHLFVIFSINSPSSSSLSVLYACPSSPYSLGLPSPANHCCFMFSSWW